jgi:hypothetical protein
MNGDSAPEGKIHTYTGLWVDPLALTPDDVDIYDIAHALSNTCRFSGHCLHFYSVAQHCVLMSRSAQSPHKLWCLLHDAGEAYLCDVPRPLKHRPEFLFFCQAEERLLDIIGGALGLGPRHVDALEYWDRVMLNTEQRDLMPDTGDPWYADIDPLIHRIEPWTPEYAKRAFLRQWEDLKWPTR